MDQVKSLESELQKTLEKIHNNMATQRQRETNEQVSLSPDEFSGVPKFGDKPSYRTPARPQAERSEEDSRLQLIKHNWNDAIKRYQIGKVHQNASLDEVAKINEGIAQFGKDWIKNPRRPSLFLSGSPGCGKTHFQFALFKALMEQGRAPSDFLFIRSDDLDNQLLKAINEKNEEWTLQMYKDVRFLFIDDLGTERVSDRIIKQYYHIIDRRMDNLKVTVFSSNISLDKIAENLGDRIASRLEMAIEVKFPKRDLRKEINFSDER